MSIPTDATAPAGRAALVLHLATIIVGVVTAVFVVFVLPSFAMQSFSDNDSGAFINQDYSVSTIAERFGFGAALLILVPTVFAILPLVVPRVARHPVAIANAILMTMFSVVSGFTLGGLYAPMAILMWAAVVVSWRVSRRQGVARSPIWRSVGGVVIALPALLVLAGLMSGSILGDWPLAIVVVVVFAVAALFVLGYRLAYMAVAATGAAIMVLGLLDAGFLMLAFWWVGGVWLALGLTATVGTSRPAALPWVLRIDRADE